MTDVKASEAAVLLDAYKRNQRQVKQAFTQADRERLRDKAYAVMRRLRRQQLIADGKLRFWQGHSTTRNVANIFVVALSAVVLWALLVLELEVLDSWWLDKLDKFRIGIIVFLFMPFCCVLSYVIVADADPPRIDELAIVVYAQKFGLVKRE
jgi:hypothetical protein